MRFEVEKLEYGKDKQLKFASKDEYYKTVGALCNEDIFLITYEENSKTNSYSDARRIKCRIDKDKLLDALKNALKTGNRINCNEFVEQLIQKHNFVFDSNTKRISGYYEKVIDTIPDKYVDVFREGYYLYREEKKNDFEKGAIFNKEAFKQYEGDNVDSARGDVKKIEKEDGTELINVFVSHKHEDLSILSGVIGFFEQKYGVKIYIDSKDVVMPQVTSGETAIRIKDRIDKCDKFILLATDKAVESKWCNWELGYGDAKKYYSGDIALLSLRDEEGSYKGNEYLSIYPHIIPAGETKISNDIKDFHIDYCVRIPKKDNTFTIITLEDWFKYSFREQEEN